MKRKSSQSPSFHFPVALDPLRVFLAVRDRWVLVVAATLLLGLIGGGIAYKLFDKTFSVSVRLTRHEPNAVTTSDLQPRRLAEATLVSQATSAPVITRTRELLGGRFASGRLRGMLQPEFDRRNRLFLFTVTSETSADEALQVLNAWVQAAIEDGKRMQQREAKAMLEHWNTSLRSLEPELAQLEQELAQFVEKEELFDSDVQLQEFLQEIHSVERSKADAEVAVQALGMQLSQYLDPDHLSLRLPVRQRLQEAEEQLEALRTDFTDIHPEVQKQTGRVETLRAQLEAELAAIRAEAESLLGRVDSDLADETFKKSLLLFAVEKLGSEGAQEVSRIVEEIRTRQLGIREQAATLETKRGELNTMPKKTAALAKIKRREQELSDTYAALQERIQDATLLDRNPPGYLELMNDQIADQYQVSTGQLKIAALSGLSTLAGLCMGILLACLGELRRSDMRTPLQAAIATRTIPRLCMLHGDSEEDESQAREFWLSQMARPDNQGRRILFPVIGDLKAEYRFWQAILENARRDHAKALFIDVAQEPLSPAFRKVLLEPVPGNGGSRRARARDGVGPAQPPHGRAGSPDEPIIIPPKDADAALADDLESMRADRQIVSTATHSLQEIGEEYLLPRDGNSAYAARYLSASDITVDELADILQEVPSQYYVLCRWTIGPSASLSTLGRHFDQYYLVNCPSSSSSKLAASHSRIYRKMLREPDGLILIDQPSRSWLLQSIQWLERKFFELKSNPKQRAAPSDEESDLL